MTRGAALVEPGHAIDLSVTIRRGDVLHFLGYPEGQAPPERIERLMEDAVRTARRFVRPRGVFIGFPPGRSRDIGLEPVEATGLVIGLVTIGAELDQIVNELVAMHAPTRALLLDAAGSAAVEEAADRLGAIVTGGDPATTGDEPAPHVSCRVSPGYGTWSIRSQEALFRVLPHSRIGVELLPTMLMTPRKSISFAMWLGADRRPVSGLSGCARCGLVECRYRRAAKVEST